MHAFLWTVIAIGILLWLAYDNWNNDGKRF